MLHLTKEVSPKPKTLNQPSLLGPRTESSRMQMRRRAHVPECTVRRDFSRRREGSAKHVHGLADTLHEAGRCQQQQQQQRRQRQQKPSPSCFTTHLPVLEGRNQPALKIDMRGERSRAAAEGEHAGRGGRWQLVAWISASQTGPMAILRTLCPAQPC